ncbi:thioredoxin 1 [Geoalkalibacter ferrihydriticus]|uniref:Thioredoxin 1 n=1 Tax=Geoalkalibacter ferrihydriticus TaxID=392333 RepID=A0A1G9WYA1_9BACT|nr:thioredoxin family protein [Geoalkalibacter ferrihydriticus]SDM89075.1 thioredoxin 1 [Geoalkalibacter ferrihydriticus]
MYELLRYRCQKFFLTSAVVAFLSLVVACEKSDSASAQGGSPVAGTGVPHLVDLGADKCIPCQMMKPILDDLEKDFAGRMDVTFIDVWKNRDEARRFGIQMIPTQIFYDEKGVELYRRSGFIGREDILATWQRLGYEFGQ